jgi:uncharacterized protein (TIGR03435 family)
MILHGILLASVVAFAQASREPVAAAAFQVVSVRPNASRSQDSGIDLHPSGQLTVTNTTLRDLIAYAYKLRDIQIVGGPADLLRERYDIAASAGADASVEQTRAMMRPVLAARFGLVVHDERREFNVYELVFARNDRRLGPALNPRPDCAVRPPDTEPPTGNRPACGGVLVSPGRSSVRGMRLDDIARGWGGDRIVVDRTGLAGGFFDIDLEYAPERLPPPGVELPPGVVPPSADSVSLFTALQEQLGLKLQPARALVDVLVVDAVKRPTPN